MNNIVMFRGAGDVATGAIQKVKRAGFNVVALEIGKPSAVRRTVSLCEAVYEKEYQVEDISAVYCENISQVYNAFKEDKVSILVDPLMSYIDQIRPFALIDATISKKNTGIKKDMAPVVIALGPGFEAGKDCDIVVETNRGHNLARLIFKGYAEKNTGNPGNILGYTKERVLYSKEKGIVRHVRKLGDSVKKGDVICYVGESAVLSKIDGNLRGLIREGLYVKEHMKLGDVDPRDDISYLYTISDKARAIGGACLEAILLGRKKYEDGKN